MKRYGAVGKAPHAAHLDIRCGRMITHPNLLSVQERERCVPSDLEAAWAWQAICTQWEKEETTTLPTLESRVFCK